MAYTGPKIAAVERGPGPGRYFLPSTVGFEEHDPTKKKNPAYLFGRRLSGKSKGDGPGPAICINSRVTRNGMDGTPSYSLLSRQKAIGNFNTPSPGAYYPEQVHPQRERIAPRYSIGFRTRHRKCDQNPAPNVYKLPQVLGSAQANKASTPSYSMTGRSNVGCYLEDLAKAPGPGHTQKVHPDVYMMKAPHYSLGARNRTTDKVVKPGPGAHFPEKVVINRQEAPKYSLGIRHTEYMCPMISYD